MATETPTVGIYTLGCKVNQYESEAIAEAFEREGFRVLPPTERCDVYVVNTCTVTAESDRKAGQFIRRARGENEAAILLVTGCFSQRDPARAAAIAGVDDVCGNADKLSVVRRAKELLKSGKGAPTVRVTPLAGVPFEEMHIEKFDRTRAYVKIEDGCENRCSYCAISAARGPVRSKRPEDVVREVETLVRGGCREIVLTGIETAAYGRDFAGFTKPGEALADLLARVDRIEGNFRVRLGSLDPSLMREDFVSKIAVLRTVAPHFHLSMQSGSSRVLAAMRRPYNAETAMRGVKRLRAAFPTLELTADFIVGFPSETDAEFEETVAFAREAAFLSMHVFAYSRRAGTPAATSPAQIPAEVKKARSAALIATGEALRRERNEAALAVPLREVLFETYENGVALGHTAEFLEVACQSPCALRSEFRTVRLLRERNGRLDGVLDDREI